MSNPTMNQFLFVVLPDLVMFIFFLGTIWRYRKAPFTYSSLSSQFLENHSHFWALVPLHYGIVTVLVGHTVAFLLPQQLLAWNSRPLRLYVLEVTALVAGLLTLVGILGAILRRIRVSKIREVTFFIPGVRRGLRQLSLLICGHLSDSVRIWGTSHCFRHL